MLLRYYLDRRAVASRRAAASQWQHDRRAAFAWLIGGDQATEAAASGDLVLAHALVRGLAANAAALRGGDSVSHLNALLRLQERRAVATPCAAEQLQELDNSSRRRCISPGRGVAWSARWQGRSTAAHRAASLLKDAGGLGGACLVVDAALACQRTRRADGVVVLKGPVGWIVICRRRVRVTSRARQGGTPCMCVGSFRNADARATLKKQPLCTVLSPVLLAFICCIIYHIGFDL